MNEKKNLSPPSPLNGRKKWRNWAKLWELIIHRCNGQSCLNLVCGVLRVEGVCITLSSTREHGATYAWKSRFSPSCKYTHGVAHQLYLAAQHTTVCLDILFIFYDAIVLYQPSTSVIVAIIWDTYVTPNTRICTFSPALKIYWQHKMNNC